MPPNLTRIARFLCATFQFSRFNFKGLKQKSSGPSVTIGAAAVNTPRRHERRGQAAGLGVSLVSTIRALCQAQAM
jgi:hypothetical protein